MRAILLFGIIYLFVPLSRVIHLPLQINWTFLPSRSAKHSLHQNPKRLPSFTGSMVVMGMTGCSETSQFINRTCETETESEIESNNRTNLYSKVKQRSLLAWTGRKRGLKKSLLAQHGPSKPVPGVWDYWPTSIFSRRITFCFGFGFFRVCFSQGRRLWE